MADGQLNTSLKEVNDLISNIDQNVTRLSGNWKKFLSEKPNLAALQAVLGQYEELAKLDKQLTKNAGGSKTGDTALKNFGNNIDTNTQRIRNQLAKLGTDASVMRSNVGVSFAGMASEITKAMQNIGQAITVTPTGNDKLNTIAQNLAERFRSETEKAMKEKAVDASKIIKTGIVQSGVAEAAGTRLSTMRTDAARLGLQPTEFDPNVISNYQQAYAELIATQQKAIDKKIEFDAIYNKGTAQTQGVEAVVSQYSKWEAELERIEKEQTELNIKQEAGLISAQEAAIKQQSLIEQQKKAKEGLARIDKTTEQADRELRAKEASDLREMASLYESIRKKRKTLAETNWDAKGRDMTKEESMLIQQTRDALQGEIDKLEQLKREYAGNAQAEQLMHDQEVKNIQHRIEMKEREAKVNAPKVSLGSSTGDVTTVSGAYRTQVKLYEEENRLLREQQALRKELTTRISTPEDKEHLQEIDNRLKQIKKDREAIANTQLFKDVSEQAKIDYAAKQTAEVRKRTNEATMATAQWANENARNARSYQQLQAAAGNIRNVLQNTELTKEEARKLSIELKNVEKKIKDSEKAMGVFREQSRSLMSIVSQLAQGFGVMFSLQQVTQFARKIVEIRGEFELQEVALKAIVQDSLKGQQIWNETMQNALKSPFSVKQLVTYTKQLAAYRIETDKLVDTTKRLADISAGLGVDMQRLILAYGQVKAAAYLRASEVRQFTEAGINMYGELSKYFSEIEGRAVSTADVVERVSKRMVSFEDVAEVFKRLTDEGGTFYNMQEVQSETVRGQVMKLRDAFDMMLNDIGEGTQGTIKGIVSALLNMTKHWETIAKTLRPIFDYFLMFKLVIPTLRTIGVAISNVGVKMELAMERMFATTRGVSALNNMLKTQGLTLKSLSINWRKFTVEMTLANQAGITGTRTMGLMRVMLMSLRTGFLGLGTAIKTAFAILTVATMLFEVIHSIANATDELSASMNRAVEESAREVSDMQTKFEQLAKTAIGATSFEEREQAYNSLKQQFSEILPAYMLENEYLAENAGRYDVASKAIENYINKKNEAKAIDEMKNTIQTGAGGVGENAGDMIAGLQGRYLGNGTEITRYQASVIESRFEQWLKAQEDISNVTNEQLRQTVDDLIKEVTGSTQVDESGFEASSFYGRVSKNAKELLENYQEIAARESEIHRQFEENTSEAQKAVDAVVAGNEEELSGVKSKVTQFNILLGKHNEYLEVSKKIANIEEQGENGDQRQLSLLQERLRVLQKYEDELNKVNTSDGGWHVPMAPQYEYGEFLKDGGVFADFIEATNIAFEQEAQTYAEQIAEFQAVRAQLEQQASEEESQEKKDEIEAAIANIDMAIKDAEDKRNAIMDSWAYSWNEATIEQVKKLNINTADTYVQRYVKQMAADGSKNMKEYGKQLRSNQKEITDELDMINRLIADGQEEFVRNVLKVSDDTIKNLEKIRDESKRQADLILGPEKKSQRSGTDPYQGRLNVLKGIFENARKVNKELYGVQVSAEKAIEKYQKAFETAFGKGRNAKGLWSVIVEQLKTAWDGGENTEQFIAALEQMQKSGFVPKKDLEKFQEFLSETKLTLGIENRKIDRDRIKKEFDQLMSDLNLSKELKKMGTPVEFYELFGLDKEEQTVDKIRQKVKEAYDKLRDENGVLSDTDEQQYQEFLNKLNEMEKKDKQDRMKTYLKYLQRELTEVEKAYYEFEKARNEINIAFAGNEKAMYNALLGANREFQKKIAAQRWKDLKSSDMYTMLFSDLDNMADETLEQLKQSIMDFLNADGIRNNLTSSELRHIQEQIDKIDDMEQKRHPFRHLGEDIDYFWKQLAKGKKAKAIEKQRAQLEKVMQMRLQYQRLQQKAGEAQANMQAGFISDAEYQKLKKEADDFGDELENEERQLDKDTRAVNRFRLAHERLASSLEKAGDEIKSITQSATSMYTNWMKMTGRMGDANDQMVQSINQMANDVGDAIGNIAKIIASEGSDITAWIGLVASIGAIISDGIDINEASIQKDIDDLTKKINTLARRVELFQKQMDKAMQMDDYFRNYNSALDSLSAKYNAIQEQYNAEQRKKNPDSEALESYQTQMDEVNDEMDALREKMRQEWGGIGESNYRSSAEEFVDAWMQAFQETGDGLSGLQDNFDEFVKNLFKKQATMRIASKMLEPLLKMIDEMVGEDGTVMRGQLDAVRERAAQIFPELNEALKSLWEELGIGSDATDTLSGLQQGIQGITEATAEVIEGYLNSIRFFIAEDNMMLRQIRDAVQSGAGNAMYMELHTQTVLLQRIWDKFDDITTANQTAHTMAVRIVA